jgi:Flp pilus assembly protein TadB
MSTALLAGMLVATIAARAGGGLRSRPRTPSARPTRKPRRALSHSPDYASLLDGIARRVRSGSSLTNAVIDEIDGSSPLHVVLDRLETGDSLAEALASVVADHGDLALTMRALSATAHLGGPIAATLDEAAAVLRERAAALAERRAHGSQARLSARVLTIVPLGFALWSAAVSQRARDVYISTAAGGGCAICGLALNLVGWRWMRRIIVAS